MAEKFLSNTFHQSRPQDEEWCFLLCSYRVWDHVQHLGEIKFFNELNPTTKQMIDTGVVSKLNSNTLEAMQELIEEIAMNCYQWQVMCQGLANQQVSMMLMQLHPWRCNWKHWAKRLMRSLQHNKELKSCNVISMGKGMTLKSVKLFVLWEDMMNKWIIWVMHIVLKRTPTTTHIVQDGGTIQISCREIKVSRDNTFHLGISSNPHFKRRSRA